ncbi:glycosyltransferase family 2 protein [Glycomyces sp. NPDC048151]|uniref:glycosyltransferase family 2 protein n=1 Tax=Glycomyces sp. NPDC048151 TaxID=3364002 RepID=UPI0037144E08
MPDVSVIVAVYNTMPYLVKCLESLLTQSIGADRIEVVAVDDGSTDGSGEELDRYAERYPGTVRVLHQANSGGPAAPSNLGLEHARGRYVFFIGADDCLGPEALERMVAAADANEADVVAGKMVGVNGKGVSKQAFAQTGPDIDFYDSKLPWAVSNTKLFRRDLVEKYSLRYPVDMRFGSDQPFTIEAMIRARRITVLGDYDYYYAIRRDDDSNITYSIDHLQRLACMARIMHFTAGLLEPGPKRDAVLMRHFHVELFNLLQADFLDLDATVQAQVCEGLAELADAYFTDAIRDRLALAKRLRVVLARPERLPLLRQFIAGPDRPSFHFDAGRAWCDYPGYRDRLAGLDDRNYEITEETVTGRLAAALRPAAVKLSPEGKLTLSFPITATAPFTGADSFAGFAAAAVRLTGPVPGPACDPEAPAAAPQPVAVAFEPLDGTRSTARVTVDYRALAAAADGAEWSLRLRLDLRGHLYDLPLTVPAGTWAHGVRKGLRGWKLRVRADKRGRAVLSVGRVSTAGLVRGRLKRMLGR